MHTYFYAHAHKYFSEDEIILILSSMGNKISGGHITQHLYVFVDFKQNVLNNTRLATIRPFSLSQDNVIAS